MLFSNLIQKITSDAPPAQLHVAGDPDIRRVCEDSRQVQPGDLFIARAGSKTSGARFAADAIGKGAVAVVSQEVLDVPGPIAFARVENANRAAALLADAFAGNPTRDMTLIAITGTKGKTTVAYLLRSILKAAGFTVGMIGTVEIDDGRIVTPADMTTPSAVDLAALFARMEKNHVTHCVMEVSSHALHQHRTAALNFKVAVFTNLTGDHLDYHKTMEEYAAAKAMLFEGLSHAGAAVINADDAWAQRMTANCPARIWRYAVRNRDGVSPVPDGPPISGIDWVGEIGEMSSEGMVLQVLGPWSSSGESSAKRRRLPITTSLVGRHNVYNLLGAASAATALGVEFTTIMRAMEKDGGPPGRLQPVAPEGVSRATLPFQVFVDYAHTHDALQNVLIALHTTMTESKKSGRLICLFGCGGDRDRTKRPKMAVIAEKLADVVIVTSDNPRTENPDAIIDDICAGFSPGWKVSGKILVEPDRRAAIGAAIHLAEPDDVVLLAGKGHENYQIIGTTKHHFDDVEEAIAALAERKTSATPPSGKVARARLQGSI